MGARSHGLQSARLVALSVMLCACARAQPERSEPALCTESLRRCPGLTVSTQQDLDAARDCEIIDGDLTFRPTNLQRVGPDALPRLQKVTGSLLSGGSTELTEITLPALREVGSSPDHVLSIGFDAHTLERVALPKLQMVDGSLGITALGGLRELDLSSLTIVTNNFGLVNLPKLSDLRLPHDVSADGRVAFQLLCQVPSVALPDRTAYDPNTLVLLDVGCCTDTATACESAMCECQ